MRDCGLDDCICIDAVMTIEIGDRSRLAEMLDTQRLYAMTMHASEPGQSSRMTIDDGDDFGVAS